jgi:tetraacyldisaccharide 4'-kinase
MIHKFIEKHWAKRNFTSFILLPFALLFSSILKIRRFCYQAKIFKSYISQSKIISIGNLTVGGTGKTPFTIFLAKYLQLRGDSVAVSHRGYKGKFEREIKLISDENSIFDCALNAGDEPFLLANNLHRIPVIVGKNRKEAIQYLKKEFSPDYIILDDSFQHLKVKHNLDFLLFNAANPIGNGFVIPSGMLRESISAIKFADIVVFSNCSENFKIPKEMSKFQKPIFQTEYQIINFVNYQNNKVHDVNYFREKKVFLVSGIGNPNSFESSIKGAGISFSHHYKFPDHHKFVYEKDILPIVRKAEKEKIDAILTTEKDFIKLQDMPASSIKFYYAKLDIKIKNFREFEELMSRKI